MRIEMHCHSIHSDGVLPAKTVAERAAERGAALFFLTDHDTCQGYEATKTIFPKARPGVELSCTDGDRRVHLLIYQGPSSHRWHVLEQVLGEQKAARRRRVHLIAERLQNLQVAFDPEPLLRAESGSIGRPHIAAELVRQGRVGSKAEAFDRFLKDGGPADVKVGQLSLSEGLRLGMEVGGRMSLAHPHVYGQRAENLIRRHQNVGLTGLEVYYGKYKPARRREFAALADRCGLVATGGSDFHGNEPNPQPPLGVEVSDTVAHRIFTWLELPIPNYDV